MPVDLSEQIVLGISSSALFDTKREHEIYESHGRDEYVRYQVENEEKPFPRGPAFPLVRAMLRLNDNFDLSRRIEVVVMSQNQPEAGLRVMNSIREYGLENLGISRGCFTGGTPVSKYLSAYNVSLFLSRHREDVQEAIKNGFAAAVLYDSPDSADIVPNQVRLAFDGDAVIFSGESEKIYQAEGIEVFHENERRNAKVPMQKGPFAEFLKLINEVQHGIEDEENFPIRTAIVTARSGPADRRVIHTLRDYGIKVDELFFMGGVEKKAVLKAFRPHIFFDDQPVHAEPASSVVQSGLVPYGSDESDLPLSSGRETSVVYRGMNQEQFRAECRSVLLPYLSHGTSRLPKEWSQFIKRNQGKDAVKRAKIVESLKRYDLSNLGLKDISLNRQGIVDVERKLRKIEGDAD